MSHIHRRERNHSLNPEMCLMLFPCAPSVAPTLSCCMSSKRTSFLVTSLRKNKTHVHQRFHLVKVQFTVWIKLCFRLFPNTFCKPECHFIIDYVILLKPDYKPAPFSEKFFLVVIEKDLNRNSVLQMWHLHLKSVQACVGKIIFDFNHLRGALFVSQSW